MLVYFLLLLLLLIPTMTAGETCSTLSRRHSKASLYHQQQLSDSTSHNGGSNFPQFPKSMSCPDNFYSHRYSCCCCCCCWKIYFCAKRVSLNDPSELRRGQGRSRRTRPRILRPPIGGWLSMLPSTGRIWFEIELDRLSLDEVAAAAAAGESSISVSSNKMMMMMMNKYLLHARGRKP